MTETPITITKHIAQLKNSQTRLAVIFLQLPNEPHKCLVVNLDVLNERYKSAVTTALYSNEGQREVDLGNYLDKIKFTGSAHSVLQELHIKNLMQPISVDMVEMLPKPNMKKNLAEILVESGKLDAELAKALFNINAQKIVKPEDIFKNMSKEAINTDNIYEMSIKSADFETKQKQAQFLLNQAEDLDHQAFLKRQQAYAILPQLDPTKQHITDTLNSNETTNRQILSVEVKESVNLNEISDNIQKTNLEDFAPNPVTGLSNNDLKSINTTKQPKLTAEQITNLMNKNSNPTTPTATIEKQTPNHKLIQAVADMFEGKITQAELDVIKNELVPTRMEQQGSGV